MPITDNIYYFHSQQGDGESPPIVLIHGAGGTHLSWPAEIRRLPGCNVFSLDLPGHGKSSGRGFQTISGYVDALISWLDALGLYRAILIGHSMEGAIALQTALSYPEHTIALGLVGSGARLRVASQIIENTTNPQTLPTALAAIREAAFSSGADTRLVEIASKRLKETRPSVLHGDFLACNSFDVMEALSTIRKPTMIINGHDDEMIPFRYAQYLAENIPGALLKGISNAGHMVMLEQPKAVMEVISSFISTVHFYPGHIIQQDTP